MELLKRSICLLLVFTLFTESVAIANTWNAPLNEEEDIVPETTATGAPACIAEGDVLPPPPAPIPNSPVSTPAIKCCEGLSSVNGKCEETPLVDSSLQRCDDTMTCGGGMGCLPQTTGSLFMRLAPTSETIDDINDNRKELEAQISEIENPQDVGGSCFHPKHCKSYSCKDNKCEDVKVCRYAAEGEVAASNVKCGPDLEKNGAGLCELSAEARNTVYLGLLDEPTIAPIGKCQFELDKETKEKSIVAMKSLRAMEYFLSTITVDFQQECFQVMPLLKHEVGGSLYESRKHILENFTKVLNDIEKDYEQIMTASEKYRQALESNGNYAGSDRSVTIHHDEVIKEGDLGSRVLSGYDAMMIMYRRNLLFQSYEKAMFEVMKMIGPKVTGLSTNMANWNDGDTSFNIGSRVVSGPCPGSKYKKKKRWKWKTKYYENAKDRWAWHYEISGSAPLNADIVKREKVSRILGLLSGYEEKGSEDEVKASMEAAEKKAVADFTSGRYYLMDPLVYGGMTHGKYGQKKSLGKKGGFLGFSGFKDLRHAQYIRGDGSGSFTRMHADTGEQLKAFYKTLKRDESIPKFVYEPELVTTSAKDCLSGNASEKCTDFDAFLGDVNDEAFAYFLAYGRHTTDSYSNFFRNATTYRRKFLAKLEVDIQNISKYYETVLKHRDEQNACIEKVMNGLIDSNILVDGPGGVQEGPSNNTGGINVKPGRVNTLPGASNFATSKKPNIGKLNPLSRTKFQFNLRDSKLSSLNSGTILDNVSSIGASSVDSASVAGGDAYLAIRADAMKKANQKASSQGVNVSGKNKAAGKIQSKIANSGARAGSQASGSSSLNTARGAFGFGNASGASVSKSGVDGSSGPSGDGVKGNEIGVGDKTGAGGDGSDAAGKDGNVDALAGIDAGAGGGGANAGGAYGQGANGAVGSGAQGGRDGTGLSDDEKERLLSEAERNKRDYQGSDDDGIFKKVSKAYVRNLDKVLIKKKKVD